MAPELIHDPEFPYVVLFGDYVAAKFPSDVSGELNAKSYADQGVGTFKDTTPAAKIPADTDYILYHDSAGLPHLARSYGESTLGRLLWWADGDLIDRDTLLEYIDGEVTVLVPKDL